MAVEDAVVLGALFSHLSQHDQIPSFLSAYQELRARRTASVRTADVGTAVMLVLPRGPVQAARDEDLRRRKGDWDEGTIKEQFESIAEIFMFAKGSLSRMTLSLGPTDLDIEMLPSWVEVMGSSLEQLRLSFGQIACSTVAQKGECKFAENML